MLAQAFGGVEVCVKGWPGGGGIGKNMNLTDANSGANLKIGYQHLNAAQALSFVRERDNLPGGDLDRTARQQAVLDYVLWKLKTDGLLTDVGRLNSLMSFAGNYLITSKGWNLLQFAGEMDALTGQNMTFHTLPITGQESVGTIGAVNTVDPAQIQAIVHKGFTEPPPDKTAGTGTGKSSAKPKSTATSGTPVPPASTVTVDVFNGGITHGLAGLVSQALVTKGYKAGLVQSVTHQSQTTVTYGAGASANAAVIARYFGVTATVGSGLAGGRVQVILGTAATSVPAALGGASGSASPTASSATSATPTPTSSVPTFTTQNGDSVTVKAKAQYGIPCVY
jgi:hypothetical protein